MQLQLQQSGNLGREYKTIAKPVPFEWKFSLAAALPQTVRWDKQFIYLIDGSYAVPTMLDHIIFIDVTCWNWVCCQLVSTHLQECQIVILENRCKSNPEHDILPFTLGSRCSFFPFIAVGDNKAER